MFLCCLEHVFGITRSYDEIRGNPLRTILGMVLTGLALAQYSLCILIPVVYHGDPTFSERLTMYVA